MSPGAPHSETYSTAQRITQLTVLARACRDVASILAAHGQTWFAEAYRDRAETGETLLRDGWSREHMVDLATAIPQPSWMNPRSDDYCAPREAWQEDAATLMDRVASAALDLRAIGILLD